VSPTPEGETCLVGNGVRGIPDALPLDTLRFRDQLNDEAFNRSLRPYPQYKGFDVYTLILSAATNVTRPFLRLEKRAS